MNESSEFAACHRTIRYEMAHLETRFGTGSFACLPSDDLDVEHGFEYIQDHPYDDFMHKHLLGLAGKFGPNLTRQLIEKGKKGNPCLLALMYETCLLNDRLHDLIPEFKGLDIKGLAECTPLIYINWSLKADRDNRAYWLELFSENLLRHRPLKAAGDFERPIPFDQQAIDAWYNSTLPISRLLPPEGNQRCQKGGLPVPTPSEIACTARERLKAIDLKAGEETENQASLSPFALKIPWHLKVTVSVGRNHWELAGPQTSYGKGLDRDQARASCWMEVAERVSSFASFDERGALRYKDGHPLIHGTYENLREEYPDVLNPNEIHLEVPYRNQPLYWVSAVRVDEKGQHPVYVPAQLVFLFSNLDEISLSTGLPSTGLAAGNTPEEARLHSLLEVIERDAERVMPYVPERCFSLAWNELPVQKILGGCRKEGIHVQFLDITSEFGIPCYKAFIQGPDGQILKGSAAHLDGKRAAVSALTEVPYHPSWFAPGSVIHGPKELDYKDLPDYSSGDVNEDLKLLERLLVSNGYSPVYVDLTRDDLDIPVVKSFIPGLEMFSELDSFSPLSLRQFGHYLNGLLPKQEFL
ncbi:MAG: YcaO-like family protein [Thermodesulfobacteriota bacterium]|nr:YcaO-like family protein [Thermodesulfobacteriota bacterium]